MRDNVYCSDKLGAPPRHLATVGEAAVKRSSS